MPFLLICCTVGIKRVELVFLRGIALYKTYSLLLIIIKPDKQVTVGSLHFTETERKKYSALCELRERSNGGAKGRELSENLTRSPCAELTLSPFAHDHRLAEPRDGRSGNSRSVADELCFASFQDFQQPPISVVGQSRRNWNRADMVKVMVTVICLFHCLTSS